MNESATSFGDCDCAVTYSTKAKSTLTVSVWDHESRQFGALAYAVPATEPVVSVLVRSGDEINEAARRLATILSSQFQRPVFVDASIPGSVGLYRQILEYVDTLIH